MDEIIEQIRNAVIGDRLPIKTPFGTKPLIYADYTASGRSLTFIEDRIRDEVLPYYANTHSDSSHCGAVTTGQREWARDVIGHAVNARAQDDVIFCGSGATAAINKFIALIGLRNEKLEPTPLVFIGPYEHHSNDLQWRELPVEVRVVPLNSMGTPDLKWLDQQLHGVAADRTIIGSFSAASNVTGVLTDVTETNKLLKSYGAITCWDFAAAAPYVSLDMSCGDGLDAMFFSPHKFIGGPGSPGVLVVNRDVLKLSVPTIPGGGTVDFVSRSKIRYSSSLVRREEAGTPDIVGSIRAGMAMELKQQVGSEKIQKLESGIIERALRRLGSHANIRVLGPLDQPRLAILSFQIIEGTRELHYSIVARAMNDLLGIQARGGCSCAGPYAHELLAINEDDSRKIDLAVAGGDFNKRPGWIRISFNYFMDEHTVEYLLRGIELIAEHSEAVQSLYEPCLTDYCESRVGTTGSNFVDLTRELRRVENFLEEIGLR